LVKRVERTSRGWSDLVRRFIAAEVKPTIVVESQHAPVEEIRGHGG